MLIDAAASGDTIVIPAGTITLSMGEILVPMDLAIQGEDASTTAIDGGGIDRAFQVAAGATVSISGLTIRNGFTDWEQPGGVILNSGTLTVANCAFLENRTYDGGGAIYNAGTLTVSDSTFSGNVAHKGGAIFSDGILTLSHSAFMGNSTDDEFGRGGAINGGFVTITDSTFSGNGAGNGGAIHSPLGVSVTNSTFSGNGAWYRGGAIDSYSDSASVDVTNSTFSDNSGVSGGAIYGYFVGVSDTTFLAAGSR